MPAMSNYLELKIADHLCRTGTFAKPAAIYIALYTDDPTDADTGTEVAGGNYSRVEVTQSDAKWNAHGTEGPMDNVDAITFPVPSGDWGVITHFGVHDASVAGNLLLHGALGVSKNVNDGDPAPNFPIGNLDLTFA